MRILMVTDFYHPFLGGVEQHVRDLSTELAARGHEIAVVTLGREGLAPFEHDGGVRVYRIGGASQRLSSLFRDAGRRWAPPIPDPAATLELAGIIRRERPDIVHGHDWLARSFLPLKRWSGARFVVTLHYYTLSCATKHMMRFEDEPCVGPSLGTCVACSELHYGRWKGRGVALAQALMSPLERRGVDMFLAVSPATAAGNGLVGSGLPYEVIPNFVLEPGVPSAHAERYLSELPSEPYLLCVGDLRPHKGVSVLLDAYARLDNAPPLVLIGKVTRTTPSELPPGARIFRDWPNHAVMEAWRRSMLALVPSIWPEPFGLVVVEAMAAGCPVIASRIGGIPDIVVDGETGLLVPPGDPVELAAAIRRLLDDKALRERMGRAGRQRAGLYSAGAVVPGIERVYAELIGVESRPALSTLVAEPLRMESKE